MKVYFSETNIKNFPTWDGTITLNSVPGVLDLKDLVKSIPCGGAWIPVPFRFNGSSSGWLGQLIIPRWRHPIASCRHDFRCRLIYTEYDLGNLTFKEVRYYRQLADYYFKQDIKIGQTSEIRSFLESNLGYMGVRIGAFFKAVTFLGS